MPSDNNKTVIITGATGLLGREVLNKFQVEPDWNVIGTGLSRAKPPRVLKLDLTDPPAIASLIKDKKPNVVIHCRCINSQSTRIVANKLL